MALDPVKLLGAGAQTSKNSYVSGLLEEVRAYNQIVSPVDKQPKADQLKRVCQVGGWYLTSKPPQSGKSKNEARWTAVKDLMEQAGAEAANLGLRLLSGPSDFKKITGAHANQSYWLEMLDPTHRPGYTLSAQFANWISNPTAISSKQSFWDFVGTDFNPSEIAVLVKYYPESTVYKDADFLLHYDAGVLLDAHDQPYDTRTRSTAFSGQGWAIFVVSPTGKIFSGSHDVGVHHHSSFLGGGAVMAAGEIVVDTGVVRFITGKSGHYKPAPANLLGWVRKCGEIPGDALINPAFGPPKFYTVADFRTNGTAATELKRLAVTTQLWRSPWCASRASLGGKMGFFDVWNAIPV
jgi:hypothetical protein